MPSCDDHMKTAIQDLMKLDGRLCDLAEAAEMLGQDKLHDKLLDALQLALSAADQVEKARKKNRRLSKTKSGSPPDVS